MLLLNGVVMDYRYQKDASSEAFHKARRAFVIIGGRVEYLPYPSDMSHYEYCNSKGIDKDTFNQITRGYYLDGKMVFYKDNFNYDDAVIKESLSHISSIAKTLDLDDFDIYFGQIPEANFRLDLFYGIYSGGGIHQNL